MRVVAGTARGVRLATVADLSVRPVLDRVKVPLFDILRSEVPGAVVLDAFAGSGSLGIEALSRGAARAVFLDTARAAIATVIANLERCRLTERALVKHVDAFQFVRNTRLVFDLVFVDPPFYKGMVEEMFTLFAERPERLSPQGGILVARLEKREKLTLQAVQLSLVDERTYGSSRLLFFRRSNTDQTA